MGSALQNRRIPHFTIIPNGVVTIDGPRGLTMADRLVLIYLMAAYPEKDVKVTVMSAALEINRRTVLRALSVLEARGYIKVTKKNGAVSLYEFTPFLDYMAGNVDLTEFNPPPEEKPKPKNAKPKAEKEENPIEEDELADPDALTPEQAKQMKAMTDRLKANFWAPPDDGDPQPLPPAPPPGSLRWEDMDRLAYIEAMRAARWRPAGLYYPSLGDPQCEEALHGIRDAVYATTQPGSHIEAWMTIEAHYTEHVRQRAVELHFDQRAEYQLRADAYARYADQAGSQPVSWQEYLERYYGQREFREFDEVKA